MHKMKVREDRLASSHARPLALDGLLDLHDHVGFAPNFGGAWRNARTDLHIILIGKTTSLSRSCLNQHIMACRNENLRTCRNKRDAILVCLYLFWYADLHSILVERLLIQRHALRRDRPQTYDSLKIRREKIATDDTRRAIHPRRYALERECNLTL